MVDLNGVVMDSSWKRYGFARVCDDVSGFVMGVSGRATD